MSSRIVNAPARRSRAFLRPALARVAPANASAVTPAWLEARLEVVRVLDVRRLDAFSAGHLPGAIAIDVRASLFDERGKVITAPELALRMSMLGIGDEHEVVVVDDGLSPDALAAAWTLEHFGHHAVHLLDGGFTRWVAEGGAVSDRIVHHAPASFTARLSA